MEKRISYVMDSYELGRLLGQGSFAKVYHGRSIKTGQHVAIKVIDKEKVMRVGLVNRVKREISVMRMMRHPNIVQLYEVMATRTKIYFVMEYAKGGELFNKLTKGRLKEDVAQNYFQQLINAVECCHCKGVYHRDLKPENLLLDDNEVLKVTDFGLSALCESKRQDGLLHTTCGTPAYVAPEVISRKGYDGAKADLWSCGVILYVLLAGYLPFSDTNLMELYRKIGQAEFNFPKWFSEDVCQLLLKMLEPNPEVRLSIAEIKENPWFRKDFKKESQVMGVAIVDQNADAELKQELIKPTELNAFDIVALSSGFNLSGLFAESHERKEKKREMFTSRKPASVIISRLIETARRLRFKVKQIDKGLLNFEVVRAGKRRCLSIDAEIFEFTPTFYMVEMRKTNGDSLQYEKTMKEDIRPALQDIVWSWQSEQKQSHLLYMHH